MMDRQTDGRTDRQTDARGKTICLPTLKGGDIIIYCVFLSPFHLFVLWSSHSIYLQHKSKHELFKKPVIFLFLNYFAAQQFVINHQMSRIIRKPNFYLCENKGADQLCSNCTADQPLCFHYNDSMIPLLLKSEIPSF